MCFYCNLINFWVVTVTSLRVTPPHLWWFSYNTSPKCFITYFTHHNISIWCQLTLLSAINFVVTSLLFDRDIPELQSQLSWHYHDVHSLEHNTTLWQWKSFTWLRCCQNNPWQSTPVGMKLYKRWCRFMSVVIKGSLRKKLTQQLITATWSM